MVDLWNIRHYSKCLDAKIVPLLLLIYSNKSSSLPRHKKFYFVLHRPLLVHTIGRLATLWALVSWSIDAVSLRCAFILFFCVHIFAVSTFFPVSLPRARLSSTIDKALFGFFHVAFNATRSFLIAVFYSRMVLGHESRFSVIFWSSTKTIGGTHSTFFSYVFIKKWFMSSLISQCFIDNYYDFLLRQLRRDSYLQWCQATDLFQTGANIYGQRTLNFNSYAANSIANYVERMKMKTINIHRYKTTILAFAFSQFFSQLVRTSPRSAKIMNCRLYHHGSTKFKTYWCISPKALQNWVYCVHKDVYNMNSSVTK